MPTCRDIITRALQQATIVPLRGTPTAAEADAGLSALIGMYEGWVSDGMFGRLKDVYKTEDYTAEEGQRIYSTGGTVTLPLTIDSGPDERAPYDLSAISIHDGEWHHWLWDGAWIELTGLTLDSDAPLASRDREGLSSALAAYLAEGFGGSVGPKTELRGARFLNSISLKFGSTQAARETDYF